MERWALIVAGGKGTRMGHAIPKQFLPLCGMPVLMHSLKAFLNADPGIRLVLVLPEDSWDYWDELCVEYGFHHPLLIVSGGTTRTESVMNGLDEVPDDVLIAIHDGVRPLVEPGTIERCYVSAEFHGSGVASVELKDSLREVKSNQSHGLDRDLYRLVQTPQVFQAGALKSAYRNRGDRSFFDDATVWEHAGNKVTLVEGHYSNIKITTPDDMLMAEALMQNGKG